MLHRHTHVGREGERVRIYLMIAKERCSSEDNISQAESVGEAVLCAVSSALFLKARYCHYECLAS